MIDDLLNGSLVAHSFFISKNIIKLQEKFLLPIFEKGGINSNIVDLEPVKQISPKFEERKISRSSVGKEISGFHIH